jgi:N-acetyl-gamma-glutamyl-phosphate reductase
MPRIGIYGATGYTGYELVKMLAQHSEAEIVFATSRSNAGQRLSDLYPCPYDQELVAPETAPMDQVDVAFCCVPHGESMGTVAELRQAGVRVLDLSADFRLRDAAVYLRWYKEEHVAPELLSQAVYGLTEVYREQIAAADVVACPGCYPTSVLLPLYPLAKTGHLHSPVIVDSKSGVSGAGRKLALASHFVEVNENLSPYNVGRVHRHLPEMEQELQAWADAPVRVTFAPHLLPVSRGILSTIYLTLGGDWSVARLIDLYREVYDGEPFVHVLSAGRLASLAYVTHTNRCAISFAEAGEGDFIILSALDNLVKGASGQALQDMNVMFGLDERMGLPC